MKLTKTQVEILKGVRRKLKYGDYSIIARNTGLTRQYISLAFSKNNDIFHEDIVNDAIKLIEKREQSNKKMLQAITALVA